MSGPGDLFCLLFLMTDSSSSMVKGRSNLSLIESESAGRFSKKEEKVVFSMGIVFY